jgi:peroxiredoxin
MRKCAYASVFASVLLAFAYGCSKAPPPPSDTQTTGAKSEQASLRAAAPAFELPDMDGTIVKLSDFKGKTVVLEWFNPDCPFVRNSHTKGSLVRTAKTWQDKGIVWLSINSSAVGKQGNGLEVNQAGKSKYAMQNPILFDVKGTVGKAYGATNTPHMFVIDPEGKLAYRGAIDNSPDGEGESPTNGTLVNYVGQALEELGAGKPVSVPETKAYGCGVKYDS